jgi:DNA-directed RNA polymerase subunit H (RpoH/RPB5)
VRVEPLSTEEVQDILKEMDRRRPRYLSDVERLVRSAETMGLGPDEVVKLIEKSKKKGEEEE